MTLQDAEVILRALKRTRITLLATGLLYICEILLFMSGFRLIYSGVSPTPNSIGWPQIAVSIMLTISIVFCLRYAIIFTYRAIRWWNIEQSPVYLLLREHPQDIVWIYDGTTQGAIELFYRTSNQRVVVIRLSDGSGYQLYSNAYFVLQLLDALVPLVPQARTGYQREWEKEYKQAPNLFRAM